MFPIQSLLKRYNQQAGEPTQTRAMSESAIVSAYLELAFPNLPTQTVPIIDLPFCVGRGKDAGNHFSIDDLRISRKCLAISSSPFGLAIEDRGQREGIFINGEPVKRRLLVHGDRIRLGTDDECQLIFRLPPETGPETGTQGAAETKLRGILGSLGNDSVEELNGLKLLLEGASLMQSQLPLESVLATMLDHAVAITRADRGMLLEPDAAGLLQVKVARGREGETLARETVNPSRSVIGKAIELETAVINGDLNLAEVDLQSAQSVVVQLLRSAVVIPLYCTPRRQSDASTEKPARELLGAVYLDSKRTAMFSALDRKILDALGAQAGSILENARLIEQERENRRLEQELNIARDIQQALVPKGLQHYQHLTVAGVYRPCEQVGGDYFDVFPLPDGRIALLIADVAGKGLGPALVTTMLQGALSGMTLGVDAVKVFNHVNDFLCGRASVGRCTTMFFGLISPDGAMEFLRAGHPSPLLLRQGVVSELYTDGSLPVGLLERAAYASTFSRLEPGDTLLLYTDGLTEAEDKDRNLFQDYRLKRLLEQHPDASLEKLQKEIFSAIEAFTEQAAQSDDLTLLVARYHGIANGDTRTT